MSNKKDSKVYTKTIFVWCGALVSCFLWGSAFPFIKLGYEAFRIASDEMGTQILFAGIRFFLAGILAIAIGCIMQRHVLIPKKKSVTKIVKLSLLQTVAQYVFFYIGLAQTTGVRASIVEGTNVFVAIAVASLIFKLEKMTAKKIVGCVVGFLGVVLVNITGTEIGGISFWMGDCLILLSTVAYAFSSVLLKEYSKEEEPIVLSGYQFFIGGIVMILAGVLMGGKIQAFSTMGIVSILYLAFVSAAAYSLWGVLMKYNSVSRVAVFGFMTPIFGVILSSLLLDEGSGLTLIHLISLILVCIGIYIVNSRNKSKDKIFSEE